MKAHQHIKTKSVTGVNLEFYYCELNGDFIRAIDNLYSPKFNWPDDLSGVTVMFTISETDDTWFYVTRNNEALLCGVWDLPLPHMTQN